MLPEQDKLIEELHREYFRKLTLYAVSALRDTSRAEDVVQDTFHEALLHIDTLMVHENPGGWLMNTVKHKIQEYKRAQGRYVHRFLSLDTDCDIKRIPSNEPPIEQMEDDEILVMERIERLLTPEEYQLLKRLTLDKASHLEVAKEFNISVYASQKRLERIRKKLYINFPDRKKKR